MSLRVAQLAFLDAQRLSAARLGVVAASALAPRLSLLLGYARCHLARARTESICFAWSRADVSRVSETEAKHKKRGTRLDRDLHAWDIEITQQALTKSRTAHSNIEAALGEPTLCPPLNPGARPGMADVCPSKEARDG